LSARPKTIVVGYDGTEAAERALGAAADLAGYGSRLAIVNVITDADASKRAAAGEGPLHQARKQLVGRQLSARYLEPIGEPAAALLDAAKVLAADLVVVGRRNRNPLQRLWPGSVSAKVVRQADCDVLVVR
jgi:nucleotide-binding universal stress UspA family protein